MPTAREIQKRIRSVKNIAQITRALEAVSASKVRRAQARVLASRAFSEKAWEILLNIQQASVHGEPLHPLLTRREEVRNVMIVLVTADRGLAGGYNTNITRAAVRFADRLKLPVQFVTIGSKGRDSLIRQRRNVIAQFSDMPADTAIADIAPAARLAMNAFLSGEVDHVYIAYTDFINTLTQRPIVITWPPLMSGMENVELVAAEFSDNHRRAPVLSGPVLDYEYEPSPEAVLDNIVPRFAELQLYQAVLESQASEHSARMVAMRNASENAVAFTADLTLLYNKARQAAITAEILDIVGGTEALQSMIDKTASRIEAEISL
jgi:F-type H+-transporting ATPase subunit gamma